MPQGVAAVAEPSEAELQSLEALGYAVGIRSDQPHADPSQLADVKDRLPALRLEQSVHARMEAGDFGEETLRSCEELVSLSPETAIFHSWLGMLLQAHRRPRAAQESFRLALSISPESVTLRNNLAMLLVEAGRIRSGDRGVRGRASNQAR